MGFPVLDSVAALVICVFIIKTAVSITLDAIGKMTDRACDDATEAEMNKVILSQESVEGIDLLRTRIFGNRVYVDVEIGVSSSLSFTAAHNVAHSVHDAIEREFPKVKHCKVHANPIDRP